MDLNDLIEKLLQGNTRATARLITIAENDIVKAEEIVKKIYKHTGNAYILGITGAPGSGKSTFISTLTKKLIDRGKKVGIICVDPTSPLSGGAILGDRIRMKQHFSLDNVFIRSMANRGVLGGLARATEDVIKILDVYGCDFIIVETVGVGQSEVDIFRSAHTVAVLLVPGLGDDIQVIKAGIMEITDIFVINKMDLPGADKKEAELNSKTGENFDKFLNALEKHRKYLEETGVISSYKINRIKNETLQILKHKLTEKIEKLIDSNSEIENYIKLVMDKSLDPYSMANLIVKLLGIDSQ
ncbi:MAG: methylmalonyl Co-A mutase-associated GTPase MeaB [Promethearchaeota archaeon]